MSMISLNTDEIKYFHDYVKTQIMFYCRKRSIYVYSEHVCVGQMFILFAYFEFWQRHN